MAGSPKGVKRGEDPAEAEARARCKAEIKAALLANEATGEPLAWRELRDRYPAVDASGPEGSRGAKERKFFRWVALVKAEIEAEKAAPGAAAAAKVQRVAGFVERQLQRELPAPAVQPDVLRNMGDVAVLPPTRKNVDFIAAIPELWEDAELIRRYGFKVAENGERAVKIPNIAYNSIKSRLDIMETALRVMQDAFDLQMMQHFYAEIVEIIVEEIGDLNATVQHRIMDRLRALQERQSAGSVIRRTGG